MLVDIVVAVELLCLLIEKTKVVANECLNFTDIFTVFESYMFVEFSKPLSILKK